MNNIIMLNIMKSILWLFSVESKGRGNIDSYQSLSNRIQLVNKTVHSSMTDFDNMTKTVHKGLNQINQKVSQKLVFLHWK